MHPGIPNQIEGFISALAHSVHAVTTDTKPASIVQRDSSTGQKQFGTDLQECFDPQSPDALESSWTLLFPCLPSTASLIATFQMATLNVEIENTENQVREFEILAAQIDNKLSLAEQNEYRRRSAHAERSLTYADFRHAVDHKFTEEHSIWQNN